MIIKHNPYKYLAAGIIAVSALMAGGCSDNQSAASASTSNVKADAVKTIGFSSKAVTVSPGKSLKLSIKGYNAKQESIPFPDKSTLNYKSDKPDAIIVEADGTVRPGTKGAMGASSVITAEYKGQTASITVKVKAALEDIVAVSGSKSVVTNQLDMAVVVNKKRALPDQYAPPDLTEPKVPFSFSEKNEKRMLRKEARARSGSNCLSHPSLLPPMTFVILRI